MIRAPVPRESDETYGTACTADTERVPRSEAPRSAGRRGLDLYPNDWPVSSSASWRMPNALGPTPCSFFSSATGTSANSLSLV